MKKVFDPKLTDVCAERIGPGIWIDGNGCAHFSIPELLEMVDLPDTPENREQVTTMVKELVRANLFPEMIVERPDHR